MIHPSLKELLEYVDGELAAAARARVGLHLESCVECQNQLAELSRRSKEIHERAAAPSTASEMEAQRGKLRARMAEAAFVAPARQVLAWSRVLTYAAALIALTSAGAIFVQHHWKAAEQARALPNPAYTPGATRQVSLGEICAEEDDEVVRPVPAAIEKRVFGEYGLSRARQGDFELDYLITPGLGGSDQVANLWPQPHASQWNSYVKDQLEDHLHHMVCRGELPLSAAQHEIAANWIAAYKKYFHTDQPLAQVDGSKPAEARLRHSGQDLELLDLELLDLRMLRKHAGL